MTNKLHNPRQNVYKPIPNTETLLLDIIKIYLPIILLYIP